MLSWEGKWEKVERENERKYREKWTEKLKKTTVELVMIKGALEFSLSLSLYSLKKIYI